MNSPNSDVLTVAQALAHINAELQPIDGFEKVALRDSLGRILADTIVSPLNVPAHANAAMDGYAFAGGDLKPTGLQTLQVIGTTWAGQPFDRVVVNGQCVRVMTGAVMPSGTDTVIMQEQVEQVGDIIQFQAKIALGEKNVRLAGEDLTAGQTVLMPGKVILPADLGLLASLGIAEVKVKRRLRVAFFSTGNELRSIGESLSPGEIYDSNRYTLYGMLARLGVDKMDMGVIQDEREALRQAFLEAAANADVLITSGGVSVGEADFTKEILAEVGQTVFWKIAMKPGRPLAFGKIGKTIFFGLPGNPVSVMVTFYQFVQPALRYMLGCSDTQVENLWKVRCLSTIKKKPGRTEFVRGILETTFDGETVVRSTGEQGSGILSSMSKANCFIVLAAEQATVNSGEWVMVQLFAGVV